MDRHGLPDVHAQQPQSALLDLRQQPQHQQRRGRAAHPRRPPLRDDRRRPTARAGARPGRLRQQRAAEPGRSVHRAGQPAHRRRRVRRPLRLVVPGSAVGSFRQPRHAQFRLQRQPALLRQRRLFAYHLAIGVARAERVRQRGGAGRQPVHHRRDARGQRRHDHRRGLLRAALRRRTGAGRQPVPAPAAAGRGRPGGRLQPGRARLELQRVLFLRPHRAAQPRHRYGVLQALLHGGGFRRRRRRQRDLPQHAHRPG